MASIKQPRFFSSGRFHNNSHLRHVTVPPHTMSSLESTSKVAIAQTTNGDLWDLNSPISAIVQSRKPHPLIKTYSTLPFNCHVLDDRKSTSLSLQKLQQIDI